jgi:hypothetical protein
MTHYIPENNLCLFQIYRQQNGYGPNEQQQRDQTIKTARFQESIKGYTTGKDILSDLLTFLKKLSWNQSQLSF